MQKGDYVVYKDVLCIIGGKAMHPYGFSIDNHFSLTKLTNAKYFCEPDVPSEALRPAILSDWAVEIPDVDPVMMVKYFDNDIRYIYLTSAFKDSFLVPTWIADALSAHYGIPIMPYELYQKYMEAQK